MKKLEHRVIVIADWEQVPLSDKSDFYTNCEYRAIISFKLCPLKTQFSQVLAKRIGYLNVSDKNKSDEGNFYGGIMSNNKAILRLETKSGRLTKEWKILKLEKNCSLQKLKEHSEQARNAANNNADSLNKYSSDKVHYGAHFKCDSY